MLNKIIVNVLGYFILIFFIVSCGGAVNSGKEDIKKNNYGDIDLEDVLQRIKNNNDSIKKFEGYCEISFFSSKKNQEQQVSSQIKIDRGKFIWVNISYFGISVARVKITPNRFAMYEKINETYIDQPFSYLQSKYFQTIDYESLENLFLGGDVTGIIKNKKNTYERDTDGNILLYEESEDVSKKIIIESYNIIAQYMKKNKTSLNIKYKEFDGGIVPKDINVHINKEKYKYILNINYKKITLDKDDLKAPFDIPDNYKVNNNV